MDQRRGGEYQAFPSKTFCLTVPKVQSFRRGNLLCCVSENFRKPKSLWIRGEEGRVSSFSVEKTLAHSGKRFRRRGGGSIKIFRPKFFVSLPRVSMGDSFSVSLISAIE